MELIHLGSRLEIFGEMPGMVEDIDWRFCFSWSKYRNEAGDIVSVNTYAQSVAVIETALPWMGMMASMPKVWGEINVDGNFMGTVAWDERPGRNRVPYVTKLWIEYDEDDGDTDARD